jgi:HD superfamily phosphohydrolase
LPLARTIEEFAQRELSSIEIEPIKAPKKIRDALTGTFVLNEYEINILDLPVVQRLRRITQTALASLTYPCTTHTRFEHTLGVTNIVSKVTSAFRDRREHKDLLDDNDIRELRIAALLHDIGHGPFSHASEEIVEELPELRAETKKTKFSRVHSKPHEILSYYVVMSEPFQNIVDKINKLYRLNLHVRRIADMIVGSMKEHKREGYISDFLNGPFDADKLDYMPRDAYFSGLKMDVDIDRIAQTCLVDQRGGANPRRLCCDISGAHNLEQILFNKVLLHSSMYHHHKVRAAVCMLKAVFEIIKDKKLEPNGLSFDKASDFISIDDYDVLSSFRNQPLLKDIIENIRNRRLLKRAVVLSRKTVKTKKLFQKLNKLMEKPEDINMLRQLIIDEMRKKNCHCSFYDLWVDLPKPPSLNEASLCKVKITEDDYCDLADVFPTDWWLTAFNETKWRGYVFCPPNENVREAAFEAASRVFRWVEDIELLPMSKTLAKI